MGLDMFLDGIHYHSAEYDDDYNVVKKRQIIKTLEVYWRKSNQIHNWFVENVQWGEDDCGYYDVSKEQLIELRDVCQKVIDNPKLAQKLLPTQDGFFFGSTDYDEWYFEDLKFTINELTKLINDEENGYDWYEYHSSW